MDHRYFFWIKFKKIVSCLWRLLQPTSSWSIADCRWRAYSFIGRFIRPARIRSVLVAQPRNPFQGFLFFFPPVIVSKNSRRNKNLSRLDISIEKKRNKSHRRATSSPNKGRSTWFKVRMNFVFPLILELKKKERKTNGHLDGCRLFFREWLHSLAVAITRPISQDGRLRLPTDVVVFGSFLLIDRFSLSTCLTTFRHPFQSSPSWCDNFNQCRHPLRKNSVFFLFKRRWIGLINKKKIKTVRWIEIRIGRYCLWRWFWFTSASSLILAVHMCGNPPTGFRHQ